MGLCSLCGSSVESTRPRQSLLVVGVVVRAALQPSFSLPHPNPQNCHFLWASARYGGWLAPIRFGLFCPSSPCSSACTALPTKKRRHCSSRPFGFCPLNQSNVYAYYVTHGADSILRACSACSRSHKEKSQPAAIQSRGATVNSLSRLAALYIQMAHKAPRRSTEGCRRPNEKAQEDRLSRRLPHAFFLFSLRIVDEWLCRIVTGVFFFFFVAGCAQCGALLQSPADPFWSGANLEFFGFFSPKKSRKTGPKSIISRGNARR